MQPNHYDLLGQVPPEAPTAGQMTRDVHQISRENVSQSRPQSGAPLTRPEGKIDLLSPQVLVFCPCIRRLPYNLDMHTASFISMYQNYHHVLTAVLYRFLDRGRIPALILLPIFCRDER